MKKCIQSIHQHYLHMPINVVQTKHPDFLIILFALLLKYS